MDDVMIIDHDLLRDSIGYGYSQVYKYKELYDSHKEPWKIVMPKSENTSFETVLQDIKEDIAEEGEPRGIHPRGIHPDEFKFIIDSLRELILSEINGVDRPRGKFL